MEIGAAIMTGARSVPLGADCFLSALSTSGSGRTLLGKVPQPCAVRKSRSFVSARRTSLRRAFAGCSLEMSVVFKLAPALPKATPQRDRKAEVAFLAST